MSRKGAVDLQTVANEAVCILTQGIRELIIPEYLYRLFDELEAMGRTTRMHAYAARHMAVISGIIGLYRLHEVREGMLVGRIFKNEELLDLGFPPISKYVRNMSSFEILRHQYAAHATRSQSDRRPGRLIPARLLGRALRETGLWDADAFLRRVREEVVPSVRRVRDVLVERYPEARQFVLKTYPNDLVAGAEGGSGGGTSAARSDWAPLSEVDKIPDERLELVRRLLHEYYPDAEHEDTYQGLRLAQVFRVLRGPHFLLVLVIPEKLARDEALRSETFQKALRDVLGKTKNQGLTVVVGPSGPVIEFGGHPLHGSLGSSAPATPARRPRGGKIR